MKLFRFHSAHPNVHIYFQEHNDAVLIIAIEISIPQGPWFVFKNIPAKKCEFQINFLVRYRYLDSISKLELGP